MKKVLALLLAALLVFGLVACTTTPSPTPAPPVDATPTPAAPDTGTGWEGTPIALVTDYGTIDDESFNQGSWEGVLAFVGRTAIPHQYIQPPAVSTAAYIDSIELAIRDGAQIVVTPGFLFREAIYEVQEMFPEIKFVLLDAVPRPEGGSPADDYVAQNTVAVLYAEEQSGFLAGYAAVMEGHRSLGFMGGVAVPAVVRFGHGFVEGAEHAAQQLGLEAGEVTIRFTYVGTFNQDPVVQTMAAAWYDDGIEVIFAAAGGAGLSVMAAADMSPAGLVIGVDVDQSHHSERVITSALKDLRSSVATVLDYFFNGEFPGGEIKIFDAAIHGVGLPMETSRFQYFTQAQYDAIFAQLADGSIIVSTDISSPDPLIVLAMELVTVTFIG